MPARSRQPVEPPASSTRHHGARTRWRVPDSERVMTVKVLDVDPILERAARLLILADVAEHLGERSVVARCHNELWQIAIRFAADNQSGAVGFYGGVIGLRDALSRRHGAPPRPR